MASIKDDQGFNQGFEMTPSTEVRMRRRADYLMSAMTDGNNKTVLEIGCGTGEIALWIAEKKQHNVIGTDICKPFIDFANENFKRDNLTYEVLDFNNPEDIKGRKFDYIIGNGILHHLYYNLDQVLVTLKDLLAEDGKLIFYEPNMYNPYIATIFNISFLRKMAHLEPDEMAFSRTYIREKLTKAGFGKVDVEYKDFLLPGIPYFLVKPSIVIGDILEKIPFTRFVSQSIFLTASK
jgi:2-polyprenyl-3-methyl-5-hydroxy-6-metoxy-1,4-benzoquinol methylase